MWGDGDMFINLMHGLADQPNLDNGAMVLDEPCVRGAPTCGELRFEVCLGFHGRGNEVRERSRRGQETFARNLGGDVDLNAGFRCGSRSLGP